MNSGRLLLFFWAAYNGYTIINDLWPPTSKSWTIDAFICPLASAYVLFYPEVWEWLRWFKESVFRKIATVILLLSVRNIMRHATGIDVNEDHTIPTMLFGLADVSVRATIFAILIPFDGPGPKLRKRIKAKLSHLKWVPEPQPEAA